MILVIAEKPSVAQSIAKVLGATSRKDGYMEGGNYIVSWCFGHLVELADASSYDERYAKWRYDDLPIVPENWMFEVTKDKAQQFKVLSALMKDKRVTELVCATDAGREGELIFRLVYNKAGCTKPFKRLWISSLEDSAIREGFNHLRDGKEYDRLYEAALSRSKADWIVGINGTRLFTTLYHKKLVVGRVQTPTLAMLVERDGKISTFQKEKYFNVHIGKGDLIADLEKVKTEEEAKKIGAVDFLAQGTIYPDVVESGLGGESAVIKSHHNVGGLPEHVDFKDIVEPLRNLFKDEVRKVGLELGLPDYLVFRQPFPGPGLGIRIIGEVTAEKVRIVQDADWIYRSEVEKAAKEYKEAHGEEPSWMPNQYFAALTNMRSVGVMGDERTYDYAVAVRAVRTVDFMTAEAAEIPFEVLQTVMSRIINEVKGVNRVFYDLTSKPPGTIEFE